jgi:ferredoxin-NADP reductase
MIRPGARELVVTARRTAADDVAEIRLAAPDGSDLPAWEPGAHIELQLTPELARQYSLCGNPAERRTWTIAVLREPASRGGSDYVHEKLVPGARVDVGDVRNHFRLEPSPGYLFIAGGIGITPLLPMAAAADRAGAQWQLSYGGRTAASMAYAGDLAARYPGQVTLQPQDECGLLDLPRIVGPPRPGVLVYCCGPEPLLRAAETACAGWPADTLHLERFAPREAGPPAVAGSFEVELARSGKTIVVDPGTSILDAVEAAGVEVLSSCLEGVCGTCETIVLGGAVDHRDSYLTEAERASGTIMMICVFRAACPRLRLDL